MHMPFFIHIFHIVVCFAFVHTRARARARASAPARFERIKKEQRMKNLK